MFQKFEKTWILDSYIRKVMPKLESSRLNGVAIIVTHTHTHTHIHTKSFLNNIVVCHFYTLVKLKHRLLQ